LEGLEQKLGGGLEPMHSPIASAATAHKIFMLNAQGKTIRRYQIPPPVKYLTFGEVANNQIKKGLSPSLPVKKVKSVNFGKVASKKVVVSYILCIWLHTAKGRRKCTKQSTFFACRPNYAKYSPIYFFHWQKHK